MEKAMEKMKNMKDGMTADKRRRVRKYGYADLTMVLVLAVGIQCMTQLEYAGERYIRNWNGYQISGSTMESCGQGSVKEYTGIKMTGVLNAKNVAGNSCVPVMVTNETVMNKITSSDGTGKDNSQSSEMGIAQEVSTPVVVTETEVSEAAKNTGVENAVADTEVTEPAAVIGGEDRNIVEEPQDVWLNLDGFIIGENGVIERCESPSLAAEDGIVILPSDDRCTGIGAEALAGITGAEEIYIPANIISIAAGALDKLESLMYIETAPDNPVYESIDGVLYSKTGELIYNPFSN